MVLVVASSELFQSFFSFLARVNDDEEENFSPKRLKEKKDGSLVPDRSLGRLLTPIPLLRCLPWLLLGFRDDERPWNGRRGGFTLSYGSPPPPFLLL